MAIGSNILYVDSKTGEVREIYNHQSSHLMYTGRVLHEHYNNEETVSDLIDHGDIFCIGYTTEPIPEDKKGDVVYCNGNNHCTFYSRELSENADKRKARVYKDLNEALELLGKKPKQFTYVFKDGKWYYKQWRNRLEEMLPIRIFHDDEEDG